MAHIANEFVRAARGGQVAKMMRCLASGSHGIIGVNDVDRDGCTALSAACQEGRTKVVSFLLDQGALVNKANDDGSTALIWAAHAGKLECVRLLLMQDADISTSGTGEFSGTALEVSRLRRHAAIGRLLETAARDGGPAAVLAERRQRALTERASQARVAVRDAEVAAEPQLRSVSAKDLEATRLAEEQRSFGDEFATTQRREAALLAIQRRRDADARAWREAAEAQRREAAEAARKEAAAKARRERVDEVRRQSSIARRSLPRTPPSPATPRGGGGGMKPPKSPRSGAGEMGSAAAAALGARQQAAQWREEQARVRREEARAKAAAARHDDAFRSLSQLVAAADVATLDDTSALERAMAEYEVVAEAAAEAAAEVSAPAAASLSLAMIDGPALLALASAKLAQATQLERPVIEMLGRLGLLDEAGAPLAEAQLGSLTAIAALSASELRAQASLTLGSASRIRSTAAAEEERLREAAAAAAAEVEAAMERERLAAEVAAVQAEVEAARAAAEAEAVAERVRKADEAAEALRRQAKEELLRAQLEPQLVAYLEAHGLLHDVGGVLLREDIDAASLQLLSIADLESIGLSTAAAVALLAAAAADQLREADLAVSESAAR